MMRAAKLTAKKTIEVQQVPIPEIKDSREVLVQVKAVGICGTDIHIFQGERSDVTLPRVMGHELSGVVVKAGEGVTRMKQGDKVVLDPVFACDSCEICKTGHENVCAHVSCYGVQMDGGFQEYIVVKERHLHKFSTKISFEQAALAEPFSIAANILARTGITEKDKVVVLGSGTIGLCIVNAVKGIGAGILVSDVVDCKLEEARKLGADVAVNSAKISLEAEVEIFSPGGATVIIDAVGIAPLTEKAIELAAPAARIAVIGFDTSPAQIPLVKITKKELTVVGSRMNCHQFPKVIEWMEKDLVNPERMVSRTYFLEDIQKAFEETIANGQETIKTLILF